MGTLCIVPCGKMKIWDKTPNAGPTYARDVYIGTFAKKCREYAEKFYPKSWLIISAKYGFLWPEDVVNGPYDVCFHDKKSNSISIEELKKQIKEKNLDKYDKIIVLGGKYYTEMIKNVFSTKEIVNPLYGCKGIGYMMAKLNESIKNENLDEKECWESEEPVFTTLREILPEEYHEEVVPFVLDFTFNICFKKSTLKKIGETIYIFGTNRDSVIVLNPNPEIAIKSEVFAWNDDRTHYQGGGEWYYKNGEEVRFDTGGDKNPYEDL